MGLGNDDVMLDDGDGGGGDADGEGKSLGAVSCSICLEIVVDDGDRSWAKLQCGHQFHLGKSIYRWVRKFYCCTAFECLGFELEEDYDGNGIRVLMTLFIKKDDQL